MFDNKQKAARLRATSRWFGYGGIVIAIALMAVWNFTTEAATDFIKAIKDVGKLILDSKFAEVSIYIWAAAGVAVLGILLGIIFRIAAHKAGKSNVKMDKKMKKTLKKIGVDKKTQKKLVKFYEKNTTATWIGAGIFALLTLKVLFGGRRKKYKNYRR